MAEDRLRVGVIGVGHLGEYHVQKYRQLDSVDLAGVVDIRPDRAEDIGRRYNAPAYTAHQELLPLVDAVSLAVPTERHFEVARDVLAQGVHLLIEKPITTDLADAQMIIDRARKAGVILQVGHVERFNPAVVKMESLITQPIFIECQRMNLFTTRGTDVDVVLDLMIHDLDIVLHLVSSRVKELHAVGMSVLTGKTDIANVRMIFEDGTVANLTASRVSDRTLRKIRIFQSDAYLAADCAKRELSITRLGEVPETLTDDPGIVSNKMRYPDSDPLADEISAFVHAVRHGGEPVVTGEDGREAVKTALAIAGQIEAGSRRFQKIA